MKTIINTAVTACLVVAALWADQLADANDQLVAAKPLIGKVVSIHDGDSITVLDAQKKQHKVRLEGIDAPEQRQAFGTRSKQALGAKLHEKDVRVEWSKLDRYGRILGDVYLDDRHINKEMITEGWAWHFKRYSSSPELAEAEKNARSGKLGIWSETDPLPPWEFRKSLDLAETALENPPPTDQGSLVYVTANGDKYHRAGCRHLTPSAHAISLDDAKKGRQPCKVCSPPQSSDENAPRELPAYAKP